MLCLHFYLSLLLISPLSFSLPSYFFLSFFGIHKECFLDREKGIGGTAASLNHRIGQPIGRCSADSLNPILVRGCKTTDELNSVRLVISKQLFAIRNICHYFSAVRPPRFFRNDIFSLLLFSLSIQTFGLLGGVLARILSLGINVVPRLP